MKLDLGTIFKVVQVVGDVIDAAGPAANELKQAFAQAGITPSQWKALADEWGQIKAIAKAEIETKG